MQNRRIYNPVQKDYVTFVKTSAETNGAATILEVELAPGGGVGVHYHKTYSEKFECLEGELKVQTGKTILTLAPGQTATAVPPVVHRFFNTSDKVCRFRCELNPASRGFEQSLQVGYGLARDGQTNRKGFPKDRLALAWLFEISESNLPGWMSLFEFILRRQAKKAKALGIDKHLTEKYVQF
jgi:quercetin dioxygenase-like cupin family protein